MPILKLKPACKDYLWGGSRLRDEYHIDTACSPLAEAWVLSCHPDGPSTIVNGPHAGRTLTEYIAEQGREVLGSYGLIFEEFPILTKLIDARDSLSIQVHPSNLYAMRHEKQYGKTEVWYVLDAQPDAFLYYGFQTEISKEEFARRIADNTLPEVLNAVPVQRGDLFFIAPGTLHAIGAGILIAEVQQNSNVTYRVSDYGRTGADGKPRQLHVEQALAVTRCEPPRTDWNFGGHLTRCEYFTVDRFDGAFDDVCDDESFTSLLVVDGAGEIACGSEQMTLQKGDSLFLPAESGAYSIAGDCTVLRTRVGTI